jgi:hypothetical protein
LTTIRRVGPRHRWMMVIRSCWSSSSSRLPAQRSGHGHPSRRGAGIAHRHLRYLLTTA